MWSGTSTGGRVLYLLLYIHCIYNSEHLQFKFIFSFHSNVKELSEQFRSGFVDNALMPTFEYSDPSSVAAEDYSAWFKQYGHKVPGNLTECDLEKEMQKVNMSAVDSVESFCLCVFFFKD